MSGFPDYLMEFFVDRHSIQEPFQKNEYRCATETWVWCSPYDHLIQIQNYTIVQIKQLHQKMSSFWRASPSIFESSSLLEWYPHMNGSKKTETVCWLRPLNRYELDITLILALGQKQCFILNLCYSSLFLLEKKLHVHFNRRNNRSQIIPIQGNIKIKWWQTDLLVHSFSHKSNWKPNAFVHST